MRAFQIVSTPAVFLAGFFMVTCAAPAPKADLTPAAKPVLAAASVCRDQWGHPTPRFEWSVWLRYFVRRNGAGLMRRTLTEPERLRFLGTYNNTEPVSDRNPERIEIFSRPDYATVVVVFVEDGCVTLTAWMMRALVEAIISPASRAPRRPGCEA